MKKYVKPAQQIYNINTSHGILSATSIMGDYNGQELHAPAFGEDFSSFFPEEGLWGKGF